MQTILHLWRALLVVPHDHVEEVGLRWLRLCICHNHLMCGSKCKCGGCDDVPFIVVILILITVILSDVVDSILFGHLHDQLITRLDHSF
jgi:hypothetical protein